MGHGHGHSHSHDHHHTGNKKALMGAFFLIASFMVVEVIGGILTNSLALLSDAGHMLSDAAALGLSFLAIKMGEKKATNSKTFGYKRFEIIAASINGITLLLISFYIFFEAYHRILEPPAVQSFGMLVISSIGLLVNIAAAFILMKGDKDHNLNVRSAFLHVLGDLLGSVGAITAALLIYFFGWGIADPIASVIVAILILISGWRVVKESFHILMEGTPSHLNPEDIKKELLKVNHVKDVHDLHIWTITSGFPSLSCHLVIEHAGGHDAVLHEAQAVLHDEYGIEHSTIQVEGEKEGCPGHRDNCN
ncbi:cobalt-zinc-cadmium efflux system protein [Cytobacillus oceanisediminis]|uniref:Cobalt-zinc-cadmium efflux system protein n=1 Tax=Cytobacillus oceanisediminis TaxID=665099 RepID=A0A2V2ZTZ4_9BACI|nr:cation diffusion facilitator family transporter [Cytobacillus oceanisediminis]PWW27878.1 cobalt-zinc-cadmium efflux system protein [Cytobacillus oceanisediminis]